MIKYNKSIVNSIKSTIKNAKNSFNNDAYSEFSNSYLSSCSDPIVRSMFNGLDNKYKNISQGYKNIDDYMDNYVKDFDSLEKSLQVFSPNCSESSVNSFLNSFVSTLPDNINYDKFSSLDKIISFNNDITIMINNYSSNGFDPDLLYTYIYANSDKISDVEDVEKILKQGNKEIEEYKKILKDKGFNDVYVKQLTKLHIYHPNWNFEISNVDTSLDEAVKEEYSDLSRNLISNRTLANDSRQYEPGWYSATPDTLKYYMDPSNFLDEKSIFMFEDIKYDSNVNDENIEAVIKGSFIDGKNFAYNGKQYNYSEVLNETGKNNNVNPIYLASRLIQEQGPNGGATAEMKSSDGKTYFNYYNFNAYGSSKDEIVNNAMKYAKEEGWDNPYSAINGAANKINESYIQNNQNTVYYQKFNVIGDNKYNHQYMANVEAPISESNKTYNSYKELNILEEEHTFLIPIYQNDKRI